MAKNQTQANSFLNNTNYNGDYIIFSCESENKDDLYNEASTLIETPRILEKDGKVLQGCYKGKKETSFIMSANYLAYILNNAEYYEQESILYLSRHKHGLYKAKLVFLDTNLPNKEIGYLRGVKKEVALKEDSYTYCPLTDQYFIITKDDNTLIGS